MRTDVGAPWLACTPSNEERQVGQVPSYVRPLDAALLRIVPWVRAPDRTAATANRRAGPRGGWPTGPDVKLEVFPRAEYADRARPEDDTRMVIYTCR